MHSLRTRSVHPRLLPSTPTTPTTSTTPSRAVCRPLHHAHARLTHAPAAGRGRREGSGAESLAPPAPHTQGGLPQGQEAQQGEDEQQGGKRLWRERRWPMNVDRVQGMAQREAVRLDAWTYKYTHFPCASPCHPSDVQTLQVEALFQNVLGYPRLPPRVHRVLVEEERDVDAITVTVEMLNDRFGKELVLYLICRAPKLIFLEFDVMMSRAEATRSMLDLRPMDMLMILRKNPYLMCLDTALVRSRYDALSRVMPLSRDSVRTLTRKCPLILNRRTELIGDVMESLRQISYTRVIWQENFDLMTPSLMAFFMRDFAVLLMRLEFLLVTGRSPNTTLKDVFKPSTNLFANVHRGYRPWLAERRERQRVQLERAQAAAARSENLQQLREAAVSESGRRYKRGGSPGEEVEDEEEQYFRQEREW